MPVEITNDITRVPMVVYQGNSAYTNSYMDAVLSTRIITKPDTIRRAKPLDLFANQTSAESVSTFQRNVAPMGEVYTVSPGVFQTTYEYPFIELYGFGASALKSNYNSVTSKILSKIKNQKVQMPVLLAEIGKTTDMFANFARTVYEGYRRLRRGEFIQGAIWDGRRNNLSEQRLLAKRWLELSYGWKPTMADIYGLYLELQKDHHSDFQFVRASSSFSKSKQVAVSGRWRSVKISETHEYRGKARFKVLATLHSAASVGISNPLATAWELIPNSFVLDWAIGVGDYLNNLDALIGIVDPVYSVTYKKNLVYTGEYKNISKNGWSAQCFSEQEIKGRTGSVPLVSPPPQWDMNVTAGRVANALALLRTLK